ncbi:hypothetical protein D3X11_05215 [Streptococcus sp. X16XC17]|nr:hypothetical protein D3X11_05215 [Streptococcus sp. X16XC17]
MTDLPDEEKVLDFEDAKDLTIGEAVRKHEEIKAGISEEDGVLDRYIKQHRQDIEAEKFETKVQQLPLMDEEVGATREVSKEVISELLGKEIPQEKSVRQESIEPVVPVAPVMPAPETAPFNEFEEYDEDSSNKKKGWIWAALISLFVGILAAAFVWMNSTEKSTDQTAIGSSVKETSSSSTKTSSTDSAQKQAVAAFETRYKAFFTDAALTKLKNSEFDKLTELKALLDQLDKDSEGYKLAKEKYDSLEKAIKATQAVNGQFDKPILVDGELDTTATVKGDAKLEPATTGIGSVDAAVTSVINFAHSQQTQNQATVNAGQTDQGNSVGEAPAQPEVPATTPPTPAPSETPTVSIHTAGFLPNAGTNHGIAVPAGVTLQRDLSRVPYDQSKIDDTSNEAWGFNPGILEHIISVSQQRGYITGNQYILEKVNIIKGNGYYNLYKPDGTYLFSINAKTGYFVGNGSGYSDALDF